MAIKEAKVVPAPVAAEPAWLDYDRFLCDSLASADPAQYCDNCIAATRRLGAQAENRVSSLFRRVNQDNYCGEGVAVSIDDELDKIDELIDEAADLVMWATVQRHQAEFQEVQPLLAQAYRQLQQVIDDLARIERRCDRH